MIIQKKVNAAIIFELDNVVRRIKPNLQHRYLRERGQIPPAPIKGEQELILPVCNYIKRYIDANNVLAIAVDQAPYIAQGVMDDDDYHATLDETKKMLREFGIQLADVGVCKHAPKINPVYDGKGNEVDVMTEPQCACRFPNPGLIDAFVGIHKLDHIKQGQHIQLRRPSYGIGVTQGFRDAMVMHMNCSYDDVRYILSGKVDLPSMITHAHLNVAAAIKDHQKRNLRTVRDDSVFVENLESLHDIHRTLPEELNKPLEGKP